MSELAWLDFDSAERSRIQRLLALFQEKETRDELGLGSIRDYISDRLFPGTSSIQTRLRYMLFVPWILLDIEARSGGREQPMNQGRRLELQLIDALKAGGEVVGVIGSSAGSSLQRLPSSTYWSGLGQWGIRTFEGSMEAYFAGLSLMLARRQREALDRESANQRRNWHPSLPDPPKAFLESCSFELTNEEAGFIKDRLLASHPKSLLSWLAHHDDGASASAIWNHPSLATFTEAHRVLVNHARFVSEVMYGAALLYNLLLSERSHSLVEGANLEDQTLDYRARLASWAGSLDLAAVRAWNPEELFTLMSHDGVTIHPQLRTFLLAWKQAVDASPHSVADTPAARMLVQGREQHLKKGQSRFTNIARLQAWSGASGSRPMAFRWNQAQSHLQDLAHAN